MVTKQYKLGKKELQNLHALVQSLFTPKLKIFPVAD